MLKLDILSFTWIYFRKKIDLIFTFHTRAAQLWKFHYDYIASRIVEPSDPTESKSIAIFSNFKIYSNAATNVLQFATATLVMSLLSFPLFLVISCCTSLPECLVNTHFPLQIKYAYLSRSWNTSCQVRASVANAVKWSHPLCEPSWIDAVRWNVQKSWGRHMPYTLTHCPCLYQHFTVCLSLCSDTDTSLFCAVTHFTVILDKQMRTLTTETHLCTKMQNGKLWLVHG